MQSDERGQKQNGYRILVSSTPEYLENNRGDLWDSGHVSSAQTLHVEYAGKPLASHTQCFWKVMAWDCHDAPSPWSSCATWTMGVLRPADWGAKWIAFPHETPTTEKQASDLPTTPATMLRKEFALNGPVKRAVVSVTGLGLYELSINGQRVGDHVLAPEWTRYDTRIQYQTYDVTKLLRNGPNAVGSQLSNGWWKGLCVPMIVQPAWAASRCCLLLRMDIELADGSQKTIVTDSSWRATDSGPIRRAGIYFGETFDGTKEIRGWNEPGFASAAWEPVETLPFPNNSPHAALVAQCNEPIRVVEELRPVSMTEPRPGVYVFDMGQNMVGWCRLKANTPAGSHIRVRHAEILTSDGMLYTDNLRGAAQVNEYIWRGGEATVEPHFTYHGFRYVELTGLATRPTSDAILGRVFHSASPEVGAFSCSNELINGIMRCVRWGQKGNMMGVPTDCPQRTERLGWMGDIQAFSQTAVFQQDMAGFFTKGMWDIRDTQAEDGRFANIAPHPGEKQWLAASNREYAPGWSDAGVIIPWRMYVNYADERLLRQHFDAIVRWIEFVRRSNPDLLWCNNRGGDYGDWLNGDMAGAWTGLKLPGYPEGISAVPTDVFATAFFAHSTEIVAKMAGILGRKGEAEKYARLFLEIKKAFNKAYVDSNGRIRGDTQAGYALALHFNLLEKDDRSKVMPHLLAAIVKYKNHPSTGIQATHRMLLELSRNGQHDEAYRLINLRTVPSLGYMLDKGATTIWERWDGFVPGRGYQDPSMNSFNHWALGAVGEWVWRELAGINPVENVPGYKHVVIHPRPAGDLRWAKARYDSIRGPIVSEWKIADGRFQLEVAIPANTTAAVFVPAKDKDSVNEGETLAAKAAGVRFLRMEGDSAVFEIASGKYRFHVAQQGAGR